MSNTKPPFSYEIFTTGDGSPTLSLEGGEKMHSLEGALSESLYIYAPCIEKALLSSHPRVLSIGLGLGYNELIAICYFINARAETFSISSFEKVDFLSSSLRSWVMHKESPLAPLYHNIVKNLGDHFALPAERIMEVARKSLINKAWVMNAPLTLENRQDLLYNSILYDAFSSDTDGPLWTREHLESFLDRYADHEQCFFSTYAATGNLKRALKAKGFLLEKKKGFGKKRESTFASRIAN